MATLEQSARALCVAAIFIGGVSSGEAQVLRGRITDAETNKYVPAAVVGVVDRQGHRILDASSGNAGAFEVHLPRSGEYRLHIALSGYVPYLSDFVAVGFGETVSISVRLSAHAIPMDPLIVSARRSGAARLAEFERRRRTSGTGYFISRDQIERRPLATPSSLVIGVPGATLATGYYADQGVILLAGTIDDYCLANIYVDGVLARAPLDALLLTEWIEGIEVYPRAGSAPAEYQRNDCGSVLFWTRDHSPGSRHWSWFRIAAASALVIGTVFLIR